MYILMNVVQMVVVIVIIIKILNKCIMICENIQKIQKMYKSICKICKRIFFLIQKKILTPLPEGYIQVLSLGYVSFPGRYLLGGTAGGII